MNELKEDYRTSAVYFCRCSLLMFFHLCHVSVRFSGPSLLEMEFVQKPFLVVCYMIILLFQGITIHRLSSDVGEEKKEPADYCVEHAAKSPEFREFCNLSVFLPYG